MILVAGPYRSGTGDDPGKMADNVRAMEAVRAAARFVRATFQSSASGSRFPW